MDCGREASARCKSSEPSCLSSFILHLEYSRAGSRMIRFTYKTLDFEIWLARYKFRAVAALFARK